MIFLHLLFHIGKEKLLCPLQSLPTFPSLNHEGFACSHLGCISFWFFCFHGTGIHPLLFLLHRTPYTTCRTRPYIFLLTECWNCWHARTRAKTCRRLARESSTCAPLPARENRERSGFARQL